MSKGICSISYLSKIENNQVSPDEEITRLLFQRLGIPLEYMEKRNTNKYTLEKQRKYRLASSYYKRATSIKNVNYWEYL